MSALIAGTRLVDSQGVAEPVFWRFLSDLHLTLPNPFAVLVDRQGRPTPIFLKMLATLSSTPPMASVALIDMKSGTATPFFERFLGGLA
ncbi:MAG: hypothetical protein JSR91_00205 [Proteobacteria bacterium]|nr:hypothetical protein [Pseudomonadota bacterium]